MIDGSKEPVFARRRKHERKPYFSAVDYSVQDGTYTDFIHNISAGGVFIGTGTPFLAGEEVSMVFPLPISRQHIRITGEIAWVSDMGIGVKFKMTRDRQKRMIKGLVELI
ncbi:MAG: PilZ domain-containing protein [Desulfobacteraceae bacterium]|jgi:Tfp pilus assembly protein PilZ